MTVAERQNPTEPLDVQLRIAETLSGQRAPDPQHYPYFDPEYDIPFIHIGTAKQLFLDNFILDDFDGVERVIVRPAKAGPPLLPWTGLPWEQQSFTAIVAGALYDPQDHKFKMWYRQALNNNPGHMDRAQVLCYAESDDALHWEKPLRDDCLPFNEHTKTNIVHPDVSLAAVVLNHDPSDPAGRRNPQHKFLMVYYPESEARRQKAKFISRVAASADGIHWQVISESTPYRHHHQVRVLWDDALQKWVAYSQYSHGFSNLSHRRMIGRQESTDFINWSPKEAILAAERDPNVPPHVEFHDMSVRKTGGLYIGVLAEAHSEPHRRVVKDTINFHDQFHTKMALYTSRDGRQFIRADGYKPWADNGPPGSQDYGYACHSAAGILVHGGKMVIPYTAQPHKQRITADVISAPEEEDRASQEHLALIAKYGAEDPRLPENDRNLHNAVAGLVLREDGWAEIKPVYEAGRATTRQFVFEGDQLRINADCSYGLVRVEILDPLLKAYPGFSLTECDPIHGLPEKIWHTVSRNGSADVRSLWNKPIRLRFHLLESNIYAFQFVAGQNGGEHG
ncbi:MAG: hypothetical protein EXR62_15410 [Chloroflexi bacterium]|nr:hypothetical protein [Chloroflexota bacterium]